MSQAHLRRQKQPPQPIIWWQMVLIFGISAMATTALFVTTNWVHSFPPTYITAPGKVFEIRRVVDGISDTQYGGKIHYRAEAHVQYLANGQIQDRWLRASDDLTPESLTLKLAAHPTACLVYWPPNHSENAKCSLK